MAFSISMGPIDTMPHSSPSCNVRAKQLASLATCIAGTIVTGYFVGNAIQSALTSKTGAPRIVEIIPTPPAARNIQINNTDVHVQGTTYCFVHLPPACKLTSHFCEATRKDVTPREWALIENCSTGQRNITVVSVGDKIFIGQVLPNCSLLNGTDPVPLEQMIINPMMGPNSYDHDAFQTTKIYFPCQPSENSSHGASPRDSNTHPANTGSIGDPPLLAEDPMPELVAVNVTLTNETNKG